jgi:isocitrate lyase
MLRKLNGGLFMTVLPQTSHELKKQWWTLPRWKDIRRDYTADDVIALRPSLAIEYSLAKHGADKLWRMMKDGDYVCALGAVTGAQSVEMVRAGLKSIYVSGWQVAADANLAGQTYPDQSLYPSNSVPALVRRINNALTRADQIEASEGRREIDWYAPILADAEAGFGGPLHAFELMKSMIEAGTSAVHFEDQLASEKKCGHLGGKVLVPTSQFIRTLKGARLAADVLGVPTLIVARTDALSATLLTSNIDERDAKFVMDERTEEGFYRVKSGLDPVISRAVAYAPYADVLWFETSKPDLDEAEEFAYEIHSRYPEKLLAYNCSPSFNWRKNLNDSEIANFNETLGAMGYKYQFVTLAGWHAINLGAYEMARDFAAREMTAYVDLQEREFAAEKCGYTAARHQREAGTGYFDKVLQVVTGGTASTAALAESTEVQQFRQHERATAS